MIPQGWKEKTLGEVCIVERGSSPRPIKNFITDDGSGVNWIKIGDCSGKYVTSTAQKITEEGAKKSRHVKEGDFVISNSMSYGKPYILKIDGYIHDGWFVLRLNKNLVNADYFYYLLSSNYVKEQYDALATGAIVQNISSDLIKRVQFNLPPLSEQERIVAKLDKAFEAIDKVKANAEKNLNNAKELFETALNNAFTENTDGWEEKTLGEVSQIISGTTPDTSNPDFWGKGNYWVTPAEINEDNLYIRKTDREITNLAIESCSLRKMPRGTIIFSSRAPIGKIAISDVDTLYCNQGFKNFICSKNIYNKFLYYFLLKNKKYIISLGKGTTFKEVSKGIISAVNIQYPSLPEQHKIVEKLDKLQEQTKQLEAIYTKKIKDLDELKQSILQKAFRGEL